MLKLVEDILSLESNLMYRKAVMMKQEQLANEQFIYRLGNLPVVSSAWTQACDMYSKTKDSNALLRVTCNLAEGGVQTVVTTAKPYVDKYQPQIEMVNAYAVWKLALFEEQYPVITKPTDEVLKEGKEKCAVVFTPVAYSVSAVKDSYNGIVNRGHETIEATKGKVIAVKDYGMTTVNRSLETPLGKYAMEKVNDALTLSEEYVEKYLPPTEEELKDDMKAPKEVDEVSTLTRVTSLGTKLQRRMYKRAMKDLGGLQMRSKERLDSLNFTVDLIQYAKSGASDVKDSLEEKYEIAQAKMIHYWKEINADMDPNEKVAVTFEEKTIFVARRLAHQMKQSMTTVSGYLPTNLQPAFVRERMEYAIKYTEDLYHTFKQAKGFDDLPSWFLAQTKDKVVYIQETISFLAETFLVGPISWMVSHREPTPGMSNPCPDTGDIEMKPIQDKGEE